MTEQPPSPNYASLMERLLLIIEGITLSIILANCGLLPPMRSLIEARLRQIEARLHELAADARARIEAARETPSEIPPSPITCQQNAAEITCAETGSPPPPRRQYGQARPHTASIIAIRPPHHPPRSFSKPASAPRFCTA